MAFSNYLTDNITLGYNWYRNGTLNATTYNISGLIAYWSFDNNSMDQWNYTYLANNSAPANKAGPLFCKVGGCYVFDGTDDYFYNSTTAPNAYLTMGTSDWSISVWIKNNGTLAESSNIYPILGNKGSGAGYTLWLRGGAGAGQWNGLLLRAGDGTHADVDIKPTSSLTANLSDNNTHHIVASMSRTGTSYVYLDNVQVASGDLSTLNGNIGTSQNFQMGAWNIYLKLTGFGVADG